MHGFMNVTFTTFYVTFLNIRTHQTPDGNELRPSWPRSCGECRKLRDGITAQPHHSAEL